MPGSQYDLAERVRIFGFNTVQVIDEELGRSGTGERLSHGVGVEDSVVGHPYTVFPVALAISSVIEYLAVAGEDGNAPASCFSSISF
jgi:hypothetical protein